MGNLPIWLQRNLKIWAVGATVSWGATAGLYACERFFNPLDSYTDSGTSGPYAVHALEVRDGEWPLYVVDGPVTEVASGDRVGWSSSICVQHGQYLLVRASLVRLRDGARVMIGRERLWTPEDHRCGSMIGALLVPPGAEPGEYEVRREAWANPLGWFPEHSTLLPLRFRVSETTKQVP